MKVVILAGGLGSRLSDETAIRPKPMIEIGNRPILWHIMNHYSHFGFNEFVLCLGYKGDCIRRYFTESSTYANDLTVDFHGNREQDCQDSVGPWRVTMVDTGENTETAGRLLKIRECVGDDTFMMTYGDGVADVNLGRLVDFHRSHSQIATVTAVHPLARFGHLTLDGDLVTTFDEKPQMSRGWINGGFFVLQPEIFDYIPGDVDWAKEPMERLADDRQLAAYRHSGFWQCMDTVRDKLYLNALWEAGNPPWKLWL